MKKLMIFMILLISLFIFSACGSGKDEDSSTTLWNEINDRGEIIVGTSGTLYPASFYPEDSDELTGYDVEVMREIAKRLNLDIKFEIIGIDGLLSSINSGRIDLAINDIEPTKTRKEKFTFSDPYKFSYTTMIVRSEDLSGIHTLEDLKGKKAGGGATTVFSTIAEHFGAEVVTYGNATNDVYLRDVDNGRTDTVINDYYLQKLAIAAFPEMDITIHPDLKFNPTVQAIAMPKDAKELHEEINRVIAEMHEDGTLTEISKQFYGGEDASKLPEEDIVEIEGINF